MCFLLIKLSGFESNGQGHFTLTAPLSTQLYIKFGTSELNAGGNPSMDQQILIHQLGGGGGELKILLVASCYRNRDKPLGSMQT